MTAIFYASSSVRTIFNWTFTSWTSHIVQPNLTTSSTKVRRAGSTYSIRKSPVGDKRREHLLCPSHHHKQFPICHCWISPLFLLLSSFHQPVLILKTVRESNFTIYGKRKQARLIFLSLSKLKSGPQEINSKEIRPHFTHSVNWNNRYKVWKNSNQDRM